MASIGHLLYNYSTIVAEADGDGGVVRTEVGQGILRLLGRPGEAAGEQGLRMHA